MPQKKTRILKYERQPNLIEAIYTGEVEKSVQESAYYGPSLEKPFNTDDLYKKTGTLKLYEEMLKDDQVFIGSQTKKDLMLGSGWDIITDDEVIKQDLIKCLNEDPEIPFESSMEEMLSANDFGYSITEKVFKTRQDGSLTLKFLKTRHPDTWIVETDTQGNPTEYVQRGVRANIKIDPMSLIHIVNNRKFQNPYGISDLRPAYAAWFCKRQIIKYYGIFLEKAASPTPVAKYPLNTPDQAITDLHDVIKQFQAKTAITVPKEVEIEFIEAKSNGEAYIKGIDIMNMMIGRSLMVPDLLGISGSEVSGGSHALGQEHIGLYFKHLERKRKILENLINYHIIKPLVITNYGFQDKMPEFKFKQIQEDNMVEKLKLWLESAKLKNYEVTDEEINYFRSQINFPIGEIERVQAGNSFVPNSVPTPLDDANNPGANKVKEFKRVFEPSEFAKRVDFKAMEKTMDSQLDSFSNASRLIVNKIFSKLIESIEKKKIVQNGNFEKINDLKLSNLSELKVLLKSSMRQAFTNAKVQAQTELMSKNFGEPLPSKEFLDFLDQEIYSYVGDYSYKVLEAVKVKLRQAVKDGKSLSEVISALDTEGQELSKTSLDRYARTKFTEVMNRGRVEMFNEAKIVEGYEYSAVLDDATTDICRGLNGKKFVKGTEPIPPMHFNALLHGSVIQTMFKDKQIQDIKIGDKVLTHKGNWCEVYDVMNKHEDKEYFTIELENGNKLKATGEHPIFVIRNGLKAWVRVDELTNLDDVICFQDIYGVYHVA